MSTSLHTIGPSSSTWCLLLDALAGSVSSSTLSFLDTLCTFVPCVLSLAGCLGQIILQWVCLDLHVVSLRGCLGRMILQYVYCVLSFSFIDLPNDVFRWII